MGDFADFVGQNALKEQICARMRFAVAGGTPLTHVLLCGAPEMGKVTLAHAVAREMAVGAQAIVCDRAIKKLDLIGVFTGV